MGLLILWQLFSLLWTMVSSSALMILHLPVALITIAYRSIIGSRGEEEGEERASAVFYEGEVFHARKRPAENSFR